MGGVPQAFLPFCRENPKKTVMKDSTLHSLKTPSAQQLGLKIQRNKGLITDCTHVLMLDYGAEASVVATSNGDFNLKPVIRVVK